MTVRVGVVGAGLVAQAEHIPYLTALRDRFIVTALAEPSATVRDALGARYGIPGLHEEFQALLAAGDVDAAQPISNAGDASRGGSLSIKRLKTSGGQPGEGQGDKYPSETPGIRPRH